MSNFGESEDMDKPEESNAKYVAFKGEVGSITYVPKQENIFKKAVEQGESLRTPVDEEYDFEL